MIFERQTFPSITQACAGLERWVAPLSDLGSLMAMLRYTDPHAVETTLTTRQQWRAACRRQRKKDLSVINKALNTKDDANTLRVVLFNATHGGSMPLGELRDLLNEEE